MGICFYTQIRGAASVFRDPSSDNTQLADFPVGTKKESYRSHDQSLQSRKAWNLGGDTLREGVR